MPDSPAEVLAMAEYSMAVPYPKSLRKIELPEPYLKWIRLIALEWSRLETIIEQIIWLLTQLDSGVGGPDREHEIGRALTTHMPYKQRIDAIKSLLHEIFGESDPTTLEFTTFSIYLDELRMDRNLVIHGEWMAGHDFPFIIHRSARKKIRKVYRIPDIAAMEELCSLIEKASNKLYDWSLDLLPPVSNFYSRSSYSKPP